MTIQKLASKIYYNPSSEIQITRTDLFEEDGDLYLKLYISNISRETLASLIVEARFLDSFGNYLLDGEFSEFSQIDLAIHSQERIGLSPFSLDPDLNLARSLEIRIKKAVFSNGDLVDYDPEDEFTMIEPALSNDYIRELRDALGPNFITYGESFSNHWRCICGFVNQDGFDNCKFCNREARLVLSQYSQASIRDQFQNKNELDLVPKEEPKADELLEVQEASPSPRNKKYLPIIAGACLALLVFAGFYLNGVRRFKGKISIGDDFLEDGDYEYALELYKDLYTSDPKPEVQSKIKLAEKLLESDKNFLEGMLAWDSGKDLAAMEHLVLVDQDDKKNFEEASESLLTLEANFIESLDNMIQTSKDDKIQASRLLSEYLQSRPDLDWEIDKLNANKKALTSMKHNLDTSLQEDRLAELEEANRQAEEAKKELELAVSKEAINNLASSLIYTNQTVQSSLANVRTGPNINSPISFRLNAGSVVYVVDTVTEGTERVWCKIETWDYHDSSYYFGWMSSVTLGY